jgi:type I restriction enzyme S subunit
VVIYYPASLKDQRAIAHILGTLDDKIELNRRMNETLEAMARAIFKSWFVDFDPVRAKAEGRHPNGLEADTAALFPASFEDSPLGKIPMGWKISSFDQLVEIWSGGTPQTSIDAYWNGDIPWFTVTDAPSESDIFVIDTGKYITQAGVDNSATRLLPVGTTIISARGTVGKLAMVGRPMAMNQTCYGLKGKKGYPDPFIYFQTKALVEELKQRTHGCVFDTIIRDTFKMLDVASPPPNVAEAFGAKVEPILQKIYGNLLESRTLAAFRDGLLPKLLSGEVRVKEAERFLEARM